MFEKNKREWKKDSPKTAMMWQSPNGYGIQAAREEWLADLFFSLRYILVRLEKGFPQDGHDVAVT
jgi:hypothetical protein